MLILTGDTIHSGRRYSVSYDHFKSISHQRRRRWCRCCLDPV